MKFLKLFAVVTVLAVSSVWAETNRPKVAVYLGTGIRGNGSSEWIRLIGEAPELEEILVDEHSVAAGALKACNILVVPGGDSRTVRKHLGAVGAEAIRQFVRDGGGYVGTCAGCCLALDEKADKERGIGLIPYHRIGNKSHGMVPIQFNAAGAAALGIAPEARDVRYSRGPVLVRVPCDDPEIKIEPWGTYAGDLATSAKFSMMGNVAVVGGTYGKGRVFAISSHPESFTWTRDIVQGALRYVTGQKVTFPLARPRTRGAVTVGFFTPALSGIACGQMLLELASNPALDLFSLDADWIHFNMLDHVDVVILPEGSETCYGKYKNVLGDILPAFAARGGKVYAWGHGVRALPPGGVVCKSASEILEKLK